MAGQAQLPGTKPLAMTGDLAAAMVAGLRDFMLKQTEASVTSREKLWQRDFSSKEAYARSVAPNRERFKTYIGAVDLRVPFDGIELVATTATPAKLHETPQYAVYAARWPVLEGVDAEGLMLQPKGEPVAKVVAIPDADWSPEMLAGLAVGIPPEAQFARRLAEYGCLVLIPTLIDRKATWSGNPRIGRKTDQSHREWIYRQAFEMGRHIIGYEVQKVLAAVDWFAREGGKAKIGVFGYGEGGLLALYAAACDTRIDAAVVSGYSQARERVWQEPIYRNVWGLLHEFGDAGVAGLIAPRPLIVEASRGPAVGKQGSTPGELISPPFESTKAEFEKAHAVDSRLTGSGDGPPGRDETLSTFLGFLNIKGPLHLGTVAKVALPGGHDPQARMKRQLDQLVAFTQRLMLLSEYRREKLWAKVNHSSPEAYAKSIKPYREMFRKELIGEVPPPTGTSNTGSTTPISRAATAATSSSACSGPTTTRPKPRPRPTCWR